MQRSRPLTVKAAWDRAEVWILLVAGALCGCGGPTPAVEEPCGEDESCEAALCYEGTCLDPDGDEDGDGLRDLVELELGTDPTSVDSDNDGLIDSYEIASVDDPTDSDGDGKLDALESVQTDGDCDGISDQDDPVEDPMSDEGIQVDLDGDGVFDICLTDSDADGLADKYDCEPSDPEIGASCPDPSPCLIGVCEAGIGCTSDPLDCDDDDRCTTDSCEPEAGGCVHVGFICDEDPCTDDACDPLTGECLVVERDCTDDDPCTTDEYCEEGTGECVSTPRNCNDDDACTNDVCLPNSGLCQSTPVQCDDGDACTGDICDPLTGECLFVAGLCDDGSPCTTDACDPLTGECVYETPDCEDGDACTIDQCDPETGDCLYVPKSCGDPVPCTDSVCNSLTGQCDHIPINCHDFEPCTDDSCDPTTDACVHEPVTCADTLHCTDDACHPGVGCVFAPTVCDDGDLCTTGSCDPDDGQCHFAPVPCDDEDPCTEDSCNAELGVCTFEPVTCDDDNPCTTDTCEAESGACLHTTQPPATLTLGSTVGTATGLALWNTDGDLAEEAATGHQLSACGDTPSAYYIASSEYSEILPEATGLAATLSTTALDALEGHIGSMGLSLADLTVRLGLGDQGADEPDVDWTYDAATQSETRHYYGVKLEVWLVDKPLISSSLGTLTGTVDHSACPPLPSPMTLESGWAYAIDLTGAAGSDTQLAAQLLLAGLGVPAKLQLSIDVATDDIQPLSTDGRTGHVLGSITGTLTGVSCAAP